MSHGHGPIGRDKPSHHDDPSRNPDAAMEASIESSVPSYAVSLLPLFPQGSSTSETRMEPNTPSFWPRSPGVYARFVEPGAPVRHPEGTDRHDAIVQSSSRGASPIPPPPPERAPQHPRENRRGKVCLAEARETLGGPGERSGEGAGRQTEGAAGSSTASTRGMIPPSSRPR